MNVKIEEAQEVTFSVVNEIPADTIVHNALVNMHPLFYCSEKIFIFEPFAQTDWHQKEISEGRHHFFSLNYADVGEYEKQYKDGDSGQGVSVVDLSNNQFWIEVFKQILSNNK